MTSIHQLTSQQGVHFPKSTLLQKSIFVYHLSQQSIDRSTQQTLLCSINQTTLYSIDQSADCLICQLFDTPIVSSIVQSSNHHGQRQFLHSQSPTAAIQDGNRGTLPNVAGVGIGEDITPANLETLLKTYIAQWNSPCTWDKDRTLRVYRHYAVGVIDVSKIYVN
jgi:hypothetical protein